MKKLNKIFSLVIVFIGLNLAVYADPCTSPLTLYTSEIPKAGNKLQNYFPGPEENVPFDNYTRTISKSYAEGGTTIIASLYKGESFNKTFTLTHGNLQEQNIELTYTPLYDQLYFSMVLNYDIISLTSNSITLADNEKPQLYNASDQLITWDTPLLANEVYKIKFPYLPANVRVVFIETVTMIGCVPAAGATHGAEVKICNQFVDQTSSNIGGVESTKLINKIEKTKSNQIVNIEAFTDRYCLSDGISKRRRQVEYVFENPNSPSDFTNFAIYLIDYVGDNNNSVLIDKASINVKLIRKDANGNDQEYDLTNTQTQGIQIDYVTKESKENCRGLEEYTFLQQMGISLGSNYSTDRYKISFDEVACCPQSFNGYNDPSYFFQVQYNNTCGGWVLWQFYPNGDFGKMDATMLPTQSPTSITATRVKDPNNPSAPDKFLGAENFISTIDFLASTRDGLAWGFPTIDVSKMEFIFALRHEDGIYLTEYDENGLPINNTVFDYQFWNNSIQGSFNPKYPNSGVTIELSNHNKIKLERLSSSDPIYTTLSTSTYPSANTYLYKIKASDILAYTSTSSRPSYIYELKALLTDAKVLWTFEPRCDQLPANDNFPEYSLEWYLKPGDNECQFCAIPLMQLKKDMLVNCPGCRFPGGDVYYSSSRRVTVGWQDLDNNHLPDKDVNGQYIPSSIAQNDDANSSNDLNLTSAILGDVVRLKHHFYLTSGQSFPYGTNGQFISIQDDLFGVNALTRSYLKVIFNKGFGLHEDAQNKMKITVRDGQTVLFTLSNISIFNTDGSLNNWIESIETGSDNTTAVFNFSVEQLSQFGMNSFTAYHSNYNIEVEFFIKVNENIKGNGDGLKQNIIVFKPYFSKVKYSDRDASHNDGELEQFNDFQADGDPMFVSNGNILYVWENFNSPNRFVNELANPYYNSHKMLFCGGGETSLQTVEIIYASKTTPLYNYDIVISDANGCGLYYTLCTQMDISLLKTVFANEIRTADDIQKVYFPIPEQSEFISAIVNISGSATGDPKYYNVNPAIVVTADGNDPNAGAFQYIKTENGFKFYSINISELVYNGNPINRGDEHENIYFTVNFNEICSGSTTSSVEFFPNPITSSSVAPYFELKPNSIDISSLFKLNPAGGKSYVTNSIKPLLLRDNNSAVVESDNSIHYSYSFRNPETGWPDPNFNNFYTIISYNSTIVNPPLLTNDADPNLVIPYFDMDKGNGVKWRYFYRLSSDNTLLKGKDIKLNLTTTFISCPDNNFKLYIGYGYNCAGDITPQTNFDLLCEYNPPSDLNFITVFVKEAKLFISDITYQNDICDQLTLQYNLLSNQGLAKEVSTTITLPNGLTYNNQPLSVRYGDVYLSASDYTVEQLTSNLLKISIVDQLIPFANAAEIGTDAINTIQVSIPLSYESGCRTFTNLAVPISVSGRSICPDITTYSTTYTISSLSNCGQLGGVSGTLSQPGGFGTLICKDEFNQYQPITVVFTKDAAMNSTYSYEWYSVNSGVSTIISGETNNSILVSEPSEVKVKVTDTQTGCYAEFSTAISGQVDFLPIDQVCIGQSPRLQLNGLNNVHGAVTTSWFKSSNPEDIMYSINEEGLYRAMAIIPGCTLTTSTEYDIRFKESPINYTFDKYLIYHGQNDVDIIVTNPDANDLNHVTIHWSHDVSKSDLLPFVTNKDGYYTVTTTLNSTGCSVSSTVKVTSPRIRIVPIQGGPGSLCQTEEVVLRAESNIIAGNYIWKYIDPTSGAGTIISTTDVATISVTGLYSVSNDLTVQTCNESFFYINLDKGSIAPIDLISNNSSDGSFEGLTNCPSVGFQSEYNCNATIPDFSDPNYAQQLIGRYMLTNNAAQWNRTNLWSGQALYNPNYTTPAAQQQMMLVDGSEASIVWSKEVSVEDYPFFLQEFMFTAHIRNVEATTTVNKLEVPKMQYKITFRTSDPVPVKRVISEGSLMEIHYTTNQNGWVQMSAMVNRFQEFIGCSDEDATTDFTHALIELIINNGGDIGRDFAVDEISFVPLDVYHCSASTPVTAVSAQYKLIPRACDATYYQLSSDEYHTCQGIPVTLSVNKYTSSNQSVVSWTAGGNVVSNDLSLSVSPSTTSIYTLKVYDPMNQCSYEKDVKVYVTEPEISIASNATLACANTTVQFEVNRFTIIGNIGYQWRINDQVIPDKTGRVIDLSNLSDQDVITCRLLNLCKDDNGQDLIVNSNSILIHGQLATANAGPDYSICYPGSATLGVATQHVVSSEWKAGASTVISTALTTTVEPLVTTDYTLTLTDENGCVSTDQVRVEIKGVTPQVNAGPDLTICPGQSVQITQSSSSVSDNVWSPAMGVSSVVNLHPTVTPTISTEYTIVATETESGCNASDKVWVNLYPAFNETIEYTSDHYIQVNIDNMQDYTFTWMSEGITRPNTTNRYATEIEGPYTITIKNKINGCEKKVVYSLVITSIQRIDNSASIQLYPNPAKQELTILCKEGFYERLEIWAVNGVKVDERTLQPVLDEQKIQLNLASGVYLIKIFNKEGEAWYSKLVIER